MSRIHKTAFKYLIVLIAAAFMLSSCEDYTYENIEGQWQLREVVTEASTQKVDTVFYSFRKGVYRHLLRISATETTESFGMYDKTDQTLGITVKVNPGGVNLDWDGRNERQFDIVKLDKSELILKYKDITYYFRKF